MQPLVPTWPAAMNGCNKFSQNKAVSFVFLWTLRYIQDHIQLFVNTHTIMIMRTSLIAVGLWRFVKIVHCGKNGRDSNIRITKYSSHNLSLEYSQNALEKN